MGRVLGLVAHGVWKIKDDKEKKEAVSKYTFHPQITRIAQINYNLSDNKDEKSALSASSADEK